MVESHGSVGRPLVLSLDHGIILGVEGNRSTLPRDLQDPAGVSLLEIVHPVDRVQVAGWLTRLPGVSPPFRRAEAEEPPRWFRLVAVSPVSSGQVTLLLEEVTHWVREADLRRRVMGALARSRGEEFLSRVPALALELVQGSGALLLDVHGPLAVVRSLAGEAGTATGAALTIEGSPLEAVVNAPGSRVYEEGLPERFPEVSLIRAAAAESAALVPIRMALGEDVLGVLAVFIGHPHRFTDGERELLETLAARAGIELAGVLSTGASGRSNPRGVQAETARRLTAEGAVNAFGNLLAAIGLNCELALESRDLSSSVSQRLVRIAESVARGGRLIRLIAMLSGTSGWTAGPVHLESVLADVADLLPLCAERLDLRVEQGSEAPVVWASESILVGLIAALALAGSAGCPQGVRVTISHRMVAGKGSPESVSLILHLEPASSGAQPQACEQVVDALDACQPLLASIRGEARLASEPEGLFVELHLMEVRAEGGGPPVAMDQP